MTIDRAVETPSNLVGSQDAGLVSEQNALTVLKSFLPDYQDAILLKALNAGKVGQNYNVEIAINWILDQQQFGKQTTPNVAAPSTTSADSSKALAVIPTSTASKVSAAQTVKPNDLSDNDLQKAIQNSLRNSEGVLGGQISAEEQELSRVIEASILEGKSRDLRQSTLFFTDPPNPHERERSGVSPVGLKNVGNTCWFSVVVQALFHLPTFRKVVFNLNMANLLSPKQQNDSQAASSSLHPKLEASKELEFMFELRHLFALLLASKRQYVDPSNVVEVLRKQESLQLRNGGIDNQQDVSEFTHLVLEWIEEAFEIIARNPTDTEIDKNANPPPVETPLMSVAGAKPNPIEQLFYGKFLIESHSPNSNSIKEDKFSQYPLQVVDYQNLHDSFESSMCHVQFDEQTQATTSVEHWLTHAPPVFLFELSRFRYNQGDNQPEKIHSEFYFPQKLYIDRYLEKNKKLVQEKRNHVRGLRQNLKRLKAQLNKFEQYGSGAAKIALTDVLAYALEFSHANSATTSLHVQDELSVNDVCMESPRISQEELNCSKTMEMTEDLASGDNNAISMDTAERPVQQHVNDFDMVDVENPHPKLVTEDELRILSNCLNRWSKEVEDQTNSLTVQINEIEKEINETYDDESLKQHVYVLHAVLVHEGQATLGHYWAFVADHTNQTWRKFNDIQVSHVDWDILVRDCYGGHQNTSAYCLIYADAKNIDLINGTTSLITIDGLLNSLPNDLRQFVEKDNAKYVQEIEAWDERHRHAMAGGDAASGTALRSPPPKHSPPNKSIESVLPLETISENCEVCRTYGDSLIQRYLRAPDGETLEALINIEIGKLAEALEKFAASGNLEEDPRVCNIAAYAMALLAPPHRIDVIVGRLLYDLVAHVFNTAPPKPAPTKNLSLEINNLYRKLVFTEDDLRDYYLVQQEFNCFSRSVLLVSFAVEHFHGKKNYVSCLQHLVLAEDYTRTLLGRDGHNRSKALDRKFLFAYKQAATVKVSEQYYDIFRSAIDEAEVVRCLNMLMTLVLPTLNELARANDEGRKTVEEIKQLWMSIFTDTNKKSLGAESDKKVQDLLDGFGAIGSTPAFPPKMTAKFKMTNDMITRYRRAVEMVSTAHIFKPVIC